MQAAKSSFTPTDVANQLDRRLFVEAARTWPDGPRAYVLAMSDMARKAETSEAKDVYLVAIEAAVRELFAEHA